MNPADLPFDADAMLDGLRAWIECESPTYDAASVSRMMDIASRELVILTAARLGKARLIDNMRVALS